MYILSSYCVISKISHFTSLGKNAVDYTGSKMDRTLASLDGNSGIQDEEYDEDANDDMIDVVTVDSMNSSDSSDLGQHLDTSNDDHQNMSKFHVEYSMITN